MPIEQIPVVREFTNVFSNDLPSLPPVRPVDFAIKLQLGMTPISKTLYRMMHKELEELKEMLQDLLNKGFIIKIVKKIEHN